jgi:hypothetical protein
MTTADDSHQGPAWSQRRGVASLLILAAAFAFGALDQYIGSLFSNFATAVSGMSAPWLLLPFAAGAAQAAWLRAAGFGLAATWLAVIGYVLMIDSPMEGVHPAVRVVTATVRSQWPWWLGGLVSGPLYGVLGWLWRSRRSWLSAALAAIPVLFEPVLGHFGFRAAIDVTASYAEAVAGLALAAYFWYSRQRVRRGAGRGGGAGGGGAPAGGGSPGGARPRHGTVYATSCGLPLRPPGLAGPPAGTSKVLPATAIGALVDVGSVCR